MMPSISLSPGLLLLEMATGSPPHKASFLTEVEDDFCERQGLSGPDGGSVREVLATIFVTCEATIDSLLAHPLFSVSALRHALLSVLGSQYA